MTTETPTAPAPISTDLPKQPNYFWHWVAIVLPIIIGLYFVPRLTKAPIRQNLAAKGLNGNADWYFVLKMPEVPTTDNAAVKEARARFGHWLDALLNAGYQPMFLSDIIEKKNKHLTLPEKSVVLLFDPGYRATYEAINPILESRNIPAVWLTPANQLERYDLRYISKHLMRNMQLGGAWDVALYEDATKRFVLTKDDDVPVSASLGWADQINFRAKNRFSDLDGLQRLAVRNYWTPRDFLNHLNVEVPLTDPATLTAKFVNDRLKGLTAPADSDNSQLPFDLISTPSKRVVAVHWPSTEGIADFDVDIAVKEVEGEIWFLLRSDEKAQRSIQVGLTSDLISVEQVEKGFIKQLAVHSVSWPKEGPFAFQTSLRGDQLKIFIKSKQVLEATVSVPSSLGDAMFGSMVYNRVRGSAQASQISLRFTPQN